MKCNHCKKIIPEKEEIIDNKECLHEECYQQKKEEKKRFYLGVGLIVLVLLVTFFSFFC